jgi:hypothetical protein
MNIELHYLLNAGLCWLIVLTAAIGYFQTARRLKQKWTFWVMLIVGWALLAVSNSLSALRIGQGTGYALAVWLSSYVMVIASLVLLFLKLIQMIQTRKELPKSPNEKVPQIDQGGLGREM